MFTWRVSVREHGYGTNDCDPLQYFNSLLTLGNALSNVSLVFRKIRSDDRQIELPQDAGIRFALEQETETFCDQLIARNLRPAQSNPVSFLQRDLMNRGSPVADSDLVLIAGEMTHFDHTITKNPIKSRFCQCKEISVMHNSVIPKPKGWGTSQLLSDHASLCAMTCDCGIPRLYASG